MSTEEEPQTPLSTSQPTLLESEETLALLATLPSFKATKISKTKNAPSRRALFQTFDIGNSFYLFGGLGSEGENRRNVDIHVYKPGKRAWAKVTPLSSFVPPNMMSNAIYRDSRPPPETLDSTKKGKKSPGKESFIIMQQHSSKMLKYMFEFTLSDKKWSKLTPSGDQPPPSHGHSFEYHKGSDSIVLFGGCAFDNITNAFNHIYTCLIPGKKEKKKKKKKKPTKFFWEKVEIPDDELQPAPRYGHVSLWLNDDTLLIHGGTNGDEEFDDMWTFDMNEKKWTEFETEGPKPSARYYHAACHCGNDIYFSFGVPYNLDLFQLNIESKKWTRFRIDGDPEPHRRWGHSMHILQKFSDKLPTLYIFGGCNIQNKYMNGIHIIHDPQTTVQVFADDQ